MKDIVSFSPKLNYLHYLKSNLSCFSMLLFVFPRTKPKHAVNICHPDKFFTVFSPQMSRRLRKKYIENFISVVFNFV